MSLFRPPYMVYLTPPAARPAALQKLNGFCSPLVMIPIESAVIPLK